VRQVPDDVSFWTLPRPELKDPQKGTASWCLHRAWYLIESVPKCGATKTHKILHHAWPHLSPLIDRQTMTSWEITCGWKIHKDLVDQPAAFEELEVWLASLAGARGGVPLTRLRLHDILLWCVVDEEAEAWGRSVLGPDGLMSLSGWPTPDKRRNQVSTY
jgi:hypothetical protein